jgi:hypothetical protein
MGLQAAMRLAAVTLLDDFADSAGVKLSTYRSRPAKINPPQAFVDTIGEVLDHSTNITQRTPVAEVVVVHGIYDYGESADQRDAFVDGFIDWAERRFHAAGPNSLIAVRDVTDLPDWTPEWSDTDARVFYATRISLEGYGLVEA